MDLKMEEVSLVNVAGGTLEQHFQELLQEAATIFADAESYESMKGNVPVKLSFELDLVYNESSGSVAVFARGGLKKPKRKLAVRGLYRSGDKFFVYDEPQQAPLFEKKPGTLRVIDQPGK